MKVKRISTFSSKSELLEVLMADCHIPFYFDGRFVSKLRTSDSNERIPCMDGSILHFIPCKKLFKIKKEEIALTSEVGRIAEYTVSCKKDSCLKGKSISTCFLTKKKRMSCATEVMSFRKRT